jgi:hypothetical protein
MPYVALISRHFSERTFRPEAPLFLVFFSEINVRMRVSAYAEEAGGCPYQRMCVRAYERFNVCALVFLNAQDALEVEEVK